MASFNGTVRPSARRFYRRTLPDLQELVVGRGIEISIDSLTVDLLEYHDLKGYISIADLSRRRMVETRAKQYLDKIDVFYVVRNTGGVIELGRKDLKEEDK